MRFRRTLPFVWVALVVVVGAWGCSSTPENTAPRVVAVGPVTKAQANVQLSFVLFDLEESPTNIRVEYSVDGGGFQGVTAIPLGGSGTRGLATRIFDYDAGVKGFPHNFLWAAQSETTAVSLDDPLVLRVTPSDDLSGESASTAAFTLRSLGF